MHFFFLIFFCVLLECYNLSPGIWNSHKDILLCGYLKISVSILGMSFSAIFAGITSGWNALSLWNDLSYCSLPLLASGHGGSLKAISWGNFKPYLLSCPFFWLHSLPLLDLVFYSSFFPQFVVFHSLSHVQLFGNPWPAVHQASQSFTIFKNLLKLMSIGSKVLSNHLILCHPLLFLPSLFPSIRIFPVELALHIRWPKY